MAVQAPTRLSVTRLPGRSSDKPSSAAVEDTDRQAEQNRGRECEDQRNVVPDRDRDEADKPARQLPLESATLEHNTNTINIIYGSTHDCLQVRDRPVIQPKSIRRRKQSKTQEHLFLVTLKMVGWLLWMVFGFPVRFAYRVLIAPIRLLQHALQLERQHSR